MQKKSGGSQPDGSGKTSKDERLGKELPDDAAAPRAERGPDNDLAFTARRSRKHHQCDIPAHEHEQQDQQHVDRQKRPTPEYS